MFYCMLYFTCDRSFKLHLQYRLCLWPIRRCRQTLERFTRYLIAHVVMSAVDCRWVVGLCTRSGNLGAVVVAPAVQFSSTVSNDRVLIVARRSRIRLVSR